MAFWEWLFAGWLVDELFGGDSKNSDRDGLQNDVRPYDCDDEEEW